MNEEFLKSFLKQTSYESMSVSDQTKGYPLPPLEMPYEGELFFLPPVMKAIPDSKDLLTLMENRRSVRKYKEGDLSLEMLSTCLFYTQGIKRTFPTATLRTVPSAGARHAFETYLLINKVAGLAPGIYRYIASKHALCAINLEPAINQKIVEATLFQHMIGSAQVSFFWVADVKRMSYRYMERSLRYLYLDAGHVCQNLYLIAEALHLGTCAVGAFTDELLNQALELDGTNQFVVYAAPLGIVE